MAFRFDLEECINYLPLNNYLEDMEHGDCCGAFIFYGFPIESFETIKQMVKKTFYDNWIEHQKYHLKAKKPIFKLTNKQIATVLFDRIFTNKAGPLLQGHLYSLILIEQQLWMKPFLIKKGFRLVSSTVKNSNTGNILYMFIRDGKKVNGKKLTKRAFT